jgi:hypothetical protein
MKTTKKERLLLQMHPEIALKVGDQFAYPHSSRQNHCDADSRIQMCARQVPGRIDRKSHPRYPKLQQLGISQRMRNK